jgi:ribosomal-protein-alanine N-acetyltransferase
MTESRLIAVIPASPSDADVLAEIHAASFPDPWTGNDFATFLSQPGVAGWLCGAETLDGFILIRRVAEESEILTLAVRPDRRRAGLARTLLEHALKNLRMRGTALCFLEVAADNVAAQRLYAATGFVNCAKRRKYYHASNGVRTDAIVMRRDL